MNVGVSDYCNLVLVALSVMLSNVYLVVREKLQDIYRTRILNVCVEM